MTDRASPAPDKAFADDVRLRGRLHVFVAFDWGEAIDLEHAARLLPARQTALARRPRTPSSIAYQPPPLTFALGSLSVSLCELGDCVAGAEATVFDFAAMSVELIVSFEVSPDGLTRLAASLSEPQPLLHVVRKAVEPLHAALLPAISQPKWSELSEEYFVFELPPDDVLPSPAQLLAEHAAWLAGLVRLDAEPLCASEVAEALAVRIGYRPSDLFVADWSAAVLLDCDCDETLQTIEFANLQLLEFRFIDQLLDQRLADAYRLVQPLVRSWLPFWRTHARPLRELGQLKIEANNLFERTDNALKLVGDQYLARVYRLLSQRFHLESWQRSIGESLTTVEGVYQVVSDQAGSYRTEVLELIVIALIVLEIVIAIWH